MLLPSLLDVPSLRHRQLQLQGLCLSPRGPLAGAVMEGGGRITN